MMQRWFAIVLIGCATGSPSWAQQPAASFPRVPPTESGDAGKSFHVQNGFRMDLLAAEPLTMDPVAMAYDENGLGWVVEMCDYPYTDKSTDVAYQERTSDLPLGRVSILEDVDGDGRFDTNTLFARDLSWPTGIALYDGGAFVAATPDIWYLKDTNGDRRADIRRKVFTGFRKFNVQAVMNNLAWGLDHRIYGAGSSNGGIIENLVQPTAKPVTISRNDYRFDPRKPILDAISGGARFGNSFDDWGNRFVCNIRNPVQHVVLPSHYLARNPYLPVPSALHDAAAAGDTLEVYRTSPPEPWRIARARRWSAERNKSYPRSETAAEGYFTSSSGVTVYRGAAYPAAYYNNIFLGEVAGNLIHRQRLAPDGVTFVARRADPNTEFVTSEDNWFRPVNFINAPDGTLHVLDMYRETIEHPWSIPDDIKSLVDLESGRDRGRIYRLSPPGFQVPRPPRLGQASIPELVATLENPNSWWRETAHRLLFERQDSAAVEPLRTLLRSSSVPLARLHAMWSLEGLHALSEQDLLIALADSAGGVREHAVRLAETRLAASRPLLERVAVLARDPEVRVRFQVAFSLGEVRDPLASEGLMAILRSDSADPWIRVALLTSLGEETDEALLRLLEDRQFTKDLKGLAYVRQLAVVVGARNRPEEVDRLLATLASLPPSPASDATQSSALLGLGDGLKRAKSGLASVVGKGKEKKPSQAWIQRVLTESAQSACDPTLPLAVRLSAIELLGFGTFEAARQPLISLLEARQPHEIQLAAVRCLASFPFPDVTPDLLAPWTKYTPALRNEVVELLLARKDRIMPVLDAVAAGTVSASQISSARLAQLLGHADPAIKSRAESLLAANPPSPRKSVIAGFQAALSLPADRQRGRVVFERECIGCHRSEDKGHDIGPHLSTIRHRSPEEVMVQILDPNREVAPNFVQYLIETDDGRISTGVIADETETSVTLKRAENVSEDILRRNIAGISNTGKSLMPEGLEQKIQVQEMADLLQYLLGPK